MLRTGLYTGFITCAKGMECMRTFLFAVVLTLSAGAAFQWKNRKVPLRQALLWSAVALAQLAVILGPSFMKGH